MTKRGHVHSVMLMLLLLLLPGLIDAQCYLMNANSDCEVCWRTVYNDDADKTGVTTMAECPASIVETWDTPLPPKMEALQKYGVVYSLHVDLSKFDVVKQGSRHVPHANIHSCIAAKGACTPFVSNSPGLATHTEALTADLDANGL
jgi:hypothetical protein